jgi:hypothetical protein
MAVMKTTYSALRLVALLCVAMVLIAALAQPVVGLLFLLLIPFWFVLATVVIVRLALVLNVCTPLPFPSLPTFAPRPPPVR